MWRRVARLGAKSLVVPASAAGAVCVYEHFRRDRFSVASGQQRPAKRAVVLGAGVVGVASAYFLALAGLEVVVVDRGEGPGRGTSAASGCLLSSRNCGVQASPSFLRRVVAAAVGGDTWLRIAPGALLDLHFLRWGLRLMLTCFSPETRRGNEEFLRRHSPYFVKLVRDVAAAEGFSNDYFAASNGLYSVYSDPVAFEKAAKSAALAGSLALGPQEAVVREPLLKEASTHISGAIFAPSDEHGDCARFTHLLAAAAERRGVRFIYGTGVSSLRLSGEGGHVVAAVLADGRELESDAFIVCMGAQSSRLLDPLGIDLPVYPLKGYSLELPDGAAGRLDTPVVFVEHNLGAIPLGPRLRFSGVAEIAGWDEYTATPSVVAQLRSDVQNLFSNLAGADSFDQAAVFVGGRPMTPDDLPVVSRTRVPNLFLNTGHCMRGWRTACGTGKALTALVLGTDPPDGIDLARLSLDRFAPLYRG